MDHYLRQGRTRLLDHHPIKWALDNLNSDDQPRRRQDRITRPVKLRALCATIGSSAYFLSQYRCATLLLMPLPERDLIKRIQQILKQRSSPSKSAGSRVITGVGDDCAVLRLAAGHEALVTTDFSLEEVHFRREWHPANVVGHRCLTRGLSDIAAMGGVPMAAFLSLALPANLDQKWVDEFLRGFSALARKFGVQLAGGDTAQSASNQSSRARTATSGPVLADIMVLGSVPRGKAVLRSGAKVGDDIYVTGKLGMGVAALNRLIAGETPKDVLRDRAARKHFWPEPRIEIGRFLRERGIASAMIDISDGLSTDLRHICDGSGVSAWIAEEAIPFATGANIDDALHGGDEYELVFTTRPQKHKLVPKSVGGVPITYIGTITKDDRAGQHRVWLVNQERGRRELEPLGWQHFERKK